MNEDLIATSSDAFPTLPDTVENGVGFFGSDWLVYDKSLKTFTDNFISFGNDYQGLITVSNFDLENITPTELAMAMQYQSYELFMLRVTGTIALTFGIFVTLVKGFRGFRNRIKGGQL